LLRLDAYRAKLGSRLLGALGRTFNLLAPRSVFAIRRASQTGEDGFPFNGRANLPQSLSDLPERVEAEDAAAS